MDLNYDSIPVKILWAGIAVGMTGWNNENLSDPFWRFYWNRSDGHAMYLFGETYEMTDKWIYVIPSGTPFSTTSVLPVDHFHVHFKVASPYHTVKPGIYQVHADKLLLDMVKQSIDIIDSGEKENPEVTILLQGLIFSALSRILNMLKPAVPKDRRIYKVQQYMLENCTKEISNNYLAGMINMNTNSFIRYFRIYTGTTPREYLIKRRIDLACESLVYSLKSIEEISEECGFCDRYYFSRMFKKVKLAGPAQYRNNTEKV